MRSIILLRTQLAVFLGALLSRWVDSMLNNQASLRGCDGRGRVESREQGMLGNSSACCVAQLGNQRLHNPVVK